MDKTTVIDTLEKMPNNFSTEELIDKLIFIEKVQQGIKDVEKGKLVSVKEAQDRISSKW